MLKAVFDTVIFVRALINPYSRCGRLIFEHFPNYRLFVSPRVVEEILEVLHRPELTAKFAGLSNLDLARVLSILGQAEVVDPDEIAEVARDPEDDKFLAASSAANADYLVSEDNDLLVLGQRHGTRIVNAATFLKILEEQAG